MYWALSISGFAGLLVMAIAWSIASRNRRRKDLKLVGDLREVEVYLLKRLHQRDPRTRRTLARGDVDPGSIAARLGELVAEIGRHEAKDDEIANADTVELGQR